MPTLVEVIVNAGSGGGGNCDETVRRIDEAFRANGVTAEIHTARGGDEIAGLAQRAAQSDAAIVCAAGGDGTVSAVAARLAGTDKILGVLPLGTLNNFSKDLGIPQDLDEAVRVVCANRVKLLDVGAVNGRVFINNSSIGLYPHIVRRREKQQRLGYGKWRAAFWAALKILRRSPFLAVRLETAGTARIVRTPFVFVGNNAYEMNFFNIGRREKLDGGRLSVYFLHRSGRGGLFALALRLITGRLRQAQDFEEVSVEEITFETKRKRILVAFDGEVKLMETPLRYQIHPRALRVAVPPEAD